MIYREHYIKPVREFYDSDLIKIITGIRRCGKSVILEQIRDEIKQKTDNVIYLNFEDKRVLANITDSDIKVYDYVESGNILGTSNSDDIYLTISKDGEFMSYEEYMASI